MTTPEEKSALLALARGAIAARLGLSSAPARVPPSLAGRRQGLFVTVHKRGEPRGDAGRVDPEADLAALAPRLAAEAAFDDPRFLPLAADEFAGMHLSLALLSPPARAASADEIRPGLHGVRLRKDGREGVFLPSAWEELNDRDLFLNALCGLKAGLEESAWREPGAALEIFTVETFSEENQA